ncbi:MAG: YkgJ family cysteine cluster protein [Candidatus Diapherotrites archaeon]|nr:YkgJ family cysteine cluster protein [Candidatus Diapherotrites archaeon]
MPDLKQICHDCKAECCKRYWITLVPEQAQKIANSLNLSLPEFIQKYTVLYLQLIPVPIPVQDPLFFSKNQFSEKIQINLEKNNSLDQNFFALPLLALKRISSEDGKKSCVFLKNNYECSIYSVRPTQCQLFPFVMPDSVENLKKIYPFCGLIEHVSAEPLKISKHEQVVKNYFEQVKQKGFQKVWPALPEQGFCFVNGKELTEISQQDLLFI